MHGPHPAAATTKFVRCAVLTVWELAELDDVVSMFLQQVIGEVLKFFMGGQSRKRLRLVGPGVALPVRHGGRGRGLAA